MGTDPTNNRSSAMTPEQLAQATEMARALVTETLKEVMAGLTPVFQNMALTPEKIQALTKPYEDPAKAARQKREMMLFKQDEETRITQERANKDACRHLDVRGQSSIRLIRNFPDRRPRGICVLCHDLITPKEWRIGPPTDKEPRGVAYLAEPHKDYMTVVHIAAHE